MSRHRKKVCPKSIWCFSGILFLFTTCLCAQPVLMRIEGKDISVREFEYWYVNGRHAVLPLEAALDDFVSYKLKVFAAEEQKLDTLPSFRMEYATFCKQFMKDCLIHRTVGDMEAQCRSGKDIGKRNTLYVVKQIVKHVPQSASLSDIQRVGCLMDSIYQSLQTGCNDSLFDSYVQDYSDVKDTSFIIPLRTFVELEDTVMAMGKNEVSRPIHAPDGIHIVKLLECKPLSLSEERNELFDRQWSACLEMDKSLEKRVEYLKEKYHYMPDAKAIVALKSGNPTIHVLFTLGEKMYTVQDFMQFAKAYPAGFKKEWEEFVVKSVLDYAVSHWMEEQTEHELKLHQYREGQLLAAITEKEVGMLVSDAVRLNNYFLEHKSDYRLENPHYKGAVVCTATKQEGRRIRKLLKGLPFNEWRQAVDWVISNAPNTNMTIDVGTFMPGDNPYIDHFVFKQGNELVDAGSSYVACIGHKVYVPDSYEEVMEQLQADFRQSLENSWVARLKASSKVEIHQEVLKTVNLR